MLNVEMDEKNGIAILEPHGPLSESDFVNATGIIDPFIAENDHLQGLIIHTKDFPGWESFGALAGHIRFVKNHHQYLSKVALVTDAKVGDFAQKIGSHFVAAEIKHYSFGQLDNARAWIINGG